MASRFQIIGLVEVHGNGSAFHQAIRNFVGNTHFYYHSPCMEGGTIRGERGGAAFLVSKEVLRSYTGGALPSLREFVEIIEDGRVIKLGLKSQTQKTLEVILVHNYKLSCQTMKRTEQIMKDNVRNGTPTFLVGDFNLYALGERKIKIPDPQAPHLLEANGEFVEVGKDDEANLRPFENRWNRIFENLIEIVSPMPTRFSQSDLTLTRIDRGFTNIPRSAMPEMKHIPGVDKDPIYWHANGISDHAPTFYIIQCRRSLPTEEQPLKAEWTKHPAYKEHFDLLHNKAELDEFPIAKQSELFKEMMRDACKFVRDKLFDEDPNSLNNTLIRLGSISRCVYSGDCKLTKTLLGFLTWPKTILGLVKMDSLN